MIAEIIPEAYDAVGKKVFRPFDRRRGPHPTFPMGRYVSQPLTVKCQNLDEIREFLRGCKGVSDEEQFGRKDYWQPPEYFEQTKKGDCDDFALWTWRQFHDLGYDCRVVFGQYGRYGTGHAWVQFTIHSTTFLVEPQFSLIGEHFPRISTLKYHPRFSVAWDGQTISYYQHANEKPHGLPFSCVVALLLEYFAIWGSFWFRNLPRIPRMLWRAIRKIGRSFRFSRARK